MTTTMTVISPSKIREMVPNPKTVVKLLDKYIIGQEQAKKVLGLMLMNRGLLKLSRQGTIVFDEPIQKSNILLIGPTGTGKTALIKALDEITGLNISICDVTSITEAGYVGNKVEDIIATHVMACEKYVRNNFEFESNDPYEEFLRDEHLKNTIETGIIYLDEIDKLRCNNNVAKDVSGMSVQNELLKILEEGDVLLSPSSIKEAKKVIRSVKTKDILFICGGAFVGLSEIIMKRRNKKASIGFNSVLKDTSFNEESEEALKYVLNEDLVEYGFKPEFLGRLPLKAILSPLNVKTMSQIIFIEKNSILSQYKSLFKVFGIDLRIEKAAIKKIAEQALSLKIGARSLKSIFSNILEEEIENIFEYQKESITITKKMVIKRGLKNV